MTEAAEISQTGYQILGWTNLAYYLGVLGYAEYVTATSGYYWVKTIFGGPANSKWTTNLGIRILLPFTTGIYGIMFVLSLFVDGIYGKFFEWMWKFSVYGFYGLNILTTFWDDIYRVWQGDTETSSILDIFGIEDTSPGIWEAFPEFKTLFFVKIGIFVLHISMYLGFRNKSQEYIDYRIKCPKGDCPLKTGKKTKETEKDEPASDDVIDNFDF